jgi:hypothetical protein
MALEALLLCESLLQQNTAIDWSVAAAAVQNSALVTRGTSYSPDVLSAAFPASPPSVHLGLSSLRRTHNSPYYIWKINEIPVAGTFSWVSETVGR